MGAAIDGLPAVRGQGGRPVQSVGFLHPGEMGVALATLVLKRGARACWTPQGRSERTRDRARTAGLDECPDLRALCAACPLLVSICPPHAALDVARAVAATGYRGLYVDANAISPAHVLEIAGLMRSAGADFVDASVVGPPPAPGTATRLYLAGKASAVVAASLAGEGLRPECLGDEPGRASALKMCHSALHKGEVALRFAALAAAQQAGVRGDLESLLASRPATARHVDGLPEDVRRVGKAWRFAGEMEEVAATLQGLGVPDGFHLAAAEVYRRLGGFRDADQRADLARLLGAICSEER